jgi:hypothetical protein
MNPSIVCMLALTTFGIVGCGEDTPTEPVTETLDLSFTGLDALANGFHYEGWAIINGGPVSTGKFNVDGSGGLTMVDGSPIPGGTFDTGVYLTATTAIVIPIEPSGDTDAVPADTHVLAGAIAGSTASLSAGDGAALGDDFLSATGDYILATPTDGAMTNENSGIWFLSLATGAPGVGLSLPTLPAGWAYEGWVVIGGQPVTTGRFTAVDVVDDADPYSDAMAGPPFPGEDFLLNAPSGLTFPTDIAGGTAVISIEPQPDDSDSPYTFKPLMGGIDVAAVDHTTYALPNMAAATFPTGSATVR